MSTSRAPLSPLGCLLDAYDQAILACRAQRAGVAYRKITVLREAHPCDSPAAAGFDGIYAWCERAIEGGDFLGAARALTQLRGAWEAADRITTPPAAATAAPVRTWSTTTDAADAMSSAAMPS